EPQPERLQSKTIDMLSPATIDVQGRINACVRKVDDALDDFVVDIGGTFGCRWVRTCEGIISATPDRPHPIILSKPATRARIIHGGRWHSLGKIILVACLYRGKIHEAQPSWLQILQLLDQFGINDLSGVD